MRRFRRIAWLAVAFGLVVLFVFWTSRITGSRIEEDGATTLAMALNLAHAGVMSLDETPPFSPTMYREPLPVLVAAAAVVITDTVHGRIPVDEYFQGPRARMLKLSNLLWMVCLTLGVYAAVRLFSPSPVLAVGGVLLMNLQVPLMRSGLAGLGLDSLYSELPAAALLVIGSALLARGLIRRRPGCAAAAGLVFGALALVKASFVYVFAGVVLGATVVGSVTLLRHRRWGAIGNVAALTVCFIVIVGPWMLRNHGQFGTFAIADRGGMVLLIRAVKDRMTAEEYRGAFYVWAPSALRPAVGRLLGFAPRDLQRGGRLQHLNRYPSADFHADDVAAEQAGRPDLAISYYRQARAQRQQLYNEARPGAELSEIDRTLQDRAFDMIREKPVSHLATTLPFLWRGAFVAAPVLTLGLVVALRRRDLALAAFLWPSFGLVLFFGLFSHFIPRYGVPVVPVVVIAVLVLPGRLWTSVRRESAPGVPLPDGQEEPAAPRPRLLP